MEFEEMKVLWDSQEDRPMYVLDEKALHASVRRKAGSIARGVRHLEWGMIAILCALGIVHVVKPIIEGVDYHRFLSAALLLGMAFWFYRGGVRRRANDRSFDTTLLGDLDKAISQIDYHILRSRTFPVWFMLPTGLIVLMNLVLRDNAWTTLSWFMVLGLVSVCMAFSYWLTRLELRCSHLPKKRELEALREKLTSPH